MEALEQKYILKLEELSAAIQSSEELAVYMDEEEDEQYQALREKFEPHIEAFHGHIAANNPLQLIDFEKRLLDDEFEGLYLPRILGYAVLRGELNDNYKYLIPQSHFRDVLLSICNSNNFDVLKQRIGQAVQIGFALSSDIWVTSLMNRVQNKRVLYFLEAQVLEKYRDIRTRKLSYSKFQKQFESLNYFTTEFPNNVSDLRRKAPSLKSFLFQRIEKKMDNSSFFPYINAFLGNTDFFGEKDFMEILMILGFYYDLSDEINNTLTTSLDEVRSSKEKADMAFFEILEDLQESKHVISAEHQKRFSKLVNKRKRDEISKYFKTLDIINSKGYFEDEAIDAARDYYYQHEGLSIQNRCLRNSIFGNFRRVLENLTPEEYPEYFELNKTITSYINIFSNQKFNQDVKALILGFIKKCTRTYTDKRGRDYQDIKKFVTSTFLDLGFMKQKELTELFKTKRKKKEA